MRRGALAELSLKSQCSSACLNEQPRVARRVGWIDRIALKSKMTALRLLCRRQSGKAALYLSAKLKGIAYRAKGFLCAADSRYRDCSECDNPPEDVLGNGD